MAHPGTPHPHDNEEAVSTQPVADRRAISGRYRVRVETLAPNGEARGRVVATLATPSDEDFLLVYGSRPRAPMDQLAFLGGLAGELLEVEAQWTLPRPGKRPKKHAPPPSVRIVAVVEAATERVVPPCPVFGTCGGCQLQQMAYAAQLAWKTQRVRATLSVIGFEEAPVLPALGCDPPWGYRNHMRFSVNRDGQPGLT
ncbi:MAG: hypothetical protein IVW57_04055, partial [Ktedonobacterales bacterium]|nr:hypothetical protein [Ktedonobacterales bacterium]